MEKDTGLAAFINHIFSTEPSEESHNHVLDMLAAQPLAERPKEELFLAYRYLQKIILMFESMDEEKIKGEKVDEDKYPQEIDWLKQIAAQTQYSPAVYQWANTHRATLLQALEEKDYFEHLARWQDMGPAEKENIVGELAALQTEIYSEGAIAFAVPEIHILPADHPTEGAVITPHSEDISKEQVKLVLNQSLLDAPSPKLALLRLHHETLHHMMVQLAFAVRDNDLPTDHPLYKDGALRLTRLMTGGHAASVIDSVYSNDGEENLAYDQEAELFMDISPIDRPDKETKEAASKPVTPPAPR